MEEEKYQNTISHTKAESIIKAAAILQQELSENEEIKIERPDINVPKKILKNLSIILFELGIFLISFFMFNYFKSYVFLIIALIMITFTVIVTIKNMIIDFILIYQKCAPERIRTSCVFEPTCSEYMILAIKKYGTIKGVIKGIQRLFRCHQPNGGVDYP